VAQSAEPTVPRAAQTYKSGGDVIDHSTKIEEIVELPQNPEVPVNGGQCCAVFSCLRDVESNVSVSRRRNLPLSHELQIVR
jgi:hypothetical protein